MNSIHPVLRLLVIGMTVLALGRAAPTMAAGNVVTRTTIERGIAVSGIAGDPTCVGYNPSIAIVFDRVMHITEFMDGPNAGKYHIETQVNGTVAITPADPDVSAVTYAGTYSLHRNELVSRTVSHVAFVNQAVATGSDGSQLKFQFHGQVVVVNGTPQVEFTKVTCIK